MRLRRPTSESDYFQRDGAIKTFLPGPINHRLTASTDLLQQLVIIEIGKVRPAVLHRLLGLAIEWSDCGLEQAQTAKSVRGIRENFASAFLANAFGSSRIRDRFFSHSLCTVRNPAICYAENGSGALKP